MMNNWLRRDRIIAVCFVLMLVMFAFVPRGPPLSNIGQSQADTLNARLEWDTQYGVDDKSAVHVVMATCNNGINGVVNLLKSTILFKQEEKLWLHVVADVESIKLLEEQVLPLAEVLSEHNVVMAVHALPQNIAKNDHQWRTLYKPCSATRLFLHELLVNLTQVVYVDTDTIFLAPPKDLWALFSKMNSSHLAGLTFEHENKTSGWYSQFAKHPYYGQAGLNSGVMLMSLEGIRSLDTWSKELSAILYKYESKFVWGDQDVLNVFFNHHPEKLLPLPCHWNYRHDHCTASGHCWESGVHGVSLLHGNKGMFLNPEGAEFKIIYDILNQLQLRDILSSQVSLKRVFIDKTISSLINHSKSICGSLLARSLYERRPKNTSSG